MSLQSTLRGGTFTFGPGQTELQEIIKVYPNPRLRSPLRATNVHEVLEALGPAHVEITSELRGLAPPGVLSDVNANLVGKVCWRNDGGGGDVMLDISTGSRFSCLGTEVTVFAQYAPVDLGLPLGIRSTIQVGVVVQWGGGVGRAGPFDTGYTPPQSLGSPHPIPSRAVSVRPIPDVGTVSLLSAGGAVKYTYTFAAGDGPRPIRAGAVLASSSVLVTYEVR